MQKHWVFKLCVPLASAAIFVGCRGEQERTAIDHATDQQKQNQEITVSGCLGTGTGTNQYMLTAVQLAPVGEQRSDAPSTTGNPITPDAQVRLAYQDNDELGRMVGRKVTITGRVIDDGRNTIGTSGSPGQTPANGSLDSRDDKSQASSAKHHSDKVAEEAGPMGKQSMNNGSFPEMRVSNIRDSGEKCPTDPTTNRR